MLRQTLQYLYLEPSVSSATDSGHVWLRGICNLGFLEIISAHGQIVFRDIQYLDLARAERALNL
jgi:hypothetical protein